MCRNEGTEESWVLSSHFLPGFDFSDQVRIAMETSIDNSVESLYPSEDYMITVPISIGVFVAVFTSLFLAVSYLPSITSTTLQLRTGVIPTLAEQKLNQYRAAVSRIHRSVLRYC